MSSGEQDICDVTPWLTDPLSKAIRTFEFALNE